ncbi:MAG: phenazine biosynthesis protein PhzF [Holophagaceae bacterium]|nr:phenazine biosynthesis protein PhzF [Holophagaceae bacterium]
MSHPFKLVDVFTSGPQTGNPLAVVFGAEGVETARMQAFAHWMNLSETAFLLPPTRPEADYRVRIFTPKGEMPFAGHPTLGTCHAWLEAGGKPKGGDTILQECGVGLVRLRRDGDTLAFAAPPLRNEAVGEDLLQEVLAALYLDPSRVEAVRFLNNGAPWLSLLLQDAADVLALEPNAAALASLPEIGVIGPHGPGSFEVRAFAVPSGILEDPVTGSLNASLAQWLIGEGRAPARYTAIQATRLGRSGRVSVAQEGGETWIGGTVRTDVEGALTSLLGS